MGLDHLLDSALKAPLLLAGGCWKRSFFESVGSVYGWVLVLGHHEDWTEPVKRLHSVVACLGSAFEGGRLQVLGAREAGALLAVGGGHSVLTLAEPGDSDLRGQHTLAPSDDLTVAVLALVVAATVLFASEPLGRGVVLLLCQGIVLVGLIVDAVDVI